MLAEVVLRPQLKPEEVDLARQAVLFELESLHMRPEQEPILMDMIHAVSCIFLYYRIHNSHERTFFRQLTEITL